MVFESVDEEYKVINNNWPNESFKKDEIFPLKIKKFNEDFMMNVPAKYIEYLNRAFPEWDITIKIDCGHHVKESECVFDKHNIPKEFDIEYDNSKYLCYSKF